MMQPHTDNNIFLLWHAASPGRLERYLRAEDGREFTAVLAARGVPMALHAETGGARTARESAAGVPSLVRLSGPIEEIASRARKEHGAVFVISDDLATVSRLSSVEGCLPVHVREGGRPNLDHSRHLEVASPNALLAYFAGPAPRALLALLTQQPGDWRAGIEERNATFRQHIEAAGGVWIFGAHSNGKIVYEECLRTGMKVLGFVDNAAAKQAMELYGLPVVGPSALDPARAGVILASGNYSLDIYHQLSKMGFQHIQNLSEFFFLSRCPVQPEMDFHADLWENRIRYHALYLLMADEKSRTVLETILRYRQSFDIRLPASVCDRQDPQWFDRDLFRADDDHVFVDGGAFDGDTALRFIRLNGGRYRSIHLFEPDPGIVRQAADNLRGYERVTIHTLGLSDKKGTLFFSQTGRMDGHLTDTDGIRVEIDTIDNVIEERITFLKMDIEGAEESALAGSAEHIRRDSPLLAIAAYHRADDLWNLPRRIGGIHPHYAFYLRHYTQISHDTVLYGLPVNVRTT